MKLRVREEKRGSLSNQERKGDLSAFMRTIITQMGLKVKVIDGILVDLID